MWDCLSRCEVLTLHNSLLRFAFPSHRVSQRFPFGDRRGAIA